MDDSPISWTKTFFDRYTQKPFCDMDEISEIFFMNFLQVILRKTGKTDNHYIVKGQTRDTLYKHIHIDMLMINPIMYKSFAKVKKLVQHLESLKLEDDTPVFRIRVFKKQIKLEVNPFFDFIKSGARGLECGTRTNYAVQKQKYRDKQKAKEQESANAPSSSINKMDEIDDPCLEISNDCQELLNLIDSDMVVIDTIKILDETIKENHYQITPAERKKAINEMKKRYPEAF